MAADAIPVASWPVELLIIRSQRCPCGGCWQLGPHHLHGEREEHLVRCASCMRERRYWFDLRALGGARAAGRRFDDFRDMFTQASQAIDEGNYGQAMVQLEELCSREPWYGPLWMELGRCQLMQGLAEHALDSLEVAVGLIPLHPDAHRWRARALATVGDSERATRAELMARRVDELIEAADESPAGD